VSRDLRLMLLDIYEFGENRWYEGRTVLTAVNEMTFTCLPLKTMTFGSKERLVKSVCFVTVCTSCTLVKTGRFIFQ
jgi:hypothetical protein